MSRASSFCRVRATGLPALVAALCVAAALGACQPLGPSEDQQPITDVRSVPVGFASFVQFNAEKSGTVEATANWASPINDVDLYATPATCADAAALAQNRCPIEAKSESTTAKPERVTFSVRAGGSYKVFAYNAGPGGETVTLTVSVR